MISQITADGSRPARRARSTLASVCPVRLSTPPRRARSGNMWPGRSRSSGRVAGSIAVRTVAARSAAEMPVVTLPRASIETVKAVPKGEVFSATIGGSPSWSHRSSVSARQMSPRPWVAMKAIASGVTFSAAIARSPSFSRSSSSTRITIRPARKAAMASAIGENWLESRMGGSARRLGAGRRQSTCPRRIRARPRRHRGRENRLAPWENGWHLDEILASESPGTPGVPPPDKSPGTSREHLERAPRERYPAKRLAPWGGGGQKGLPIEKNQT